MTLNLQLNSLANLFGVQDPIDRRVFSLPLEVIAIVGIINAFDMVNGIDGLCAGIALLALVAIAPRMGFVPPFIGIV